MRVCVCSDKNRKQLDRWLQNGPVSLVMVPERFYYWEGELELLPPEIKKIQKYLSTQISINFYILKVSYSLYSMCLIRSPKQMDPFLKNNSTQLIKKISFFLCKSRDFRKKSLEMFFFKSLISDLT